MFTRVDYFSRRALGFPRAQFLDFSVRSLARLAPGPTVAVLLRCLPILYLLRPHLRHFLAEGAEPWLLVIPTTVSLVPILGYISLPISVRFSLVVEKGNHLNRGPRNALRLLEDRQPETDSGYVLTRHF